MIRSRGNAKESGLQWVPISVRMSVAGFRKMATNSLTPLSLRAWGPMSLGWLVTTTLRANGRLGSKKRSQDTSSETVAAIENYGSLEMERSKEILNIFWR